MTERSKFIYLLNAMERAAQATNPAKAGYGAKRQAVLDYVRRIEEAARPCQREHVEYRPVSRSDNRFYGDENNG